MYCDWVILENLRIRWKSEFIKLPQVFIVTFCCSYGLSCIPAINKDRGQKRILSIVINYWENINVFGYMLLFWAHKFCNLKFSLFSQYLLLCWNIPIYSCLVSWFLCFSKKRKSLFGFTFFWHILDNCGFKTSYFLYKNSIFQALFILFIGLN